ncbi:MAG TPA: hypothetical protein VKB93_12735 [Thermoanaerobaculia bacterium]|nr:hypothetical protein [Thermoanaerobaculia bacterium]
MSLFLSLALLFASDLEQPRALLVLDDGTVLASRPMLNDVVALRDRNGDGRADEIRTALSSIEGASAMAMRGDTLYVAGTNAVFAAERSADGSFSEPAEIVPDTGAIGIGPDGLLYVATRDRLLQFDSEGGGRRIYSRGALTAFGWDAANLWGIDDTGALLRIGDGVREASSLRVSSSALAFANGAAFAASRDSIVRLNFEKQTAENFIEGVHASSLAAAKDGTLFYSDGANVYRSSPTPAPMTSSGLEPVKTILSKSFHLDGFRAPTSVVHDEEQDVYFVANAGFVARVTPAGKIEEPKFIDGLKSPQGMALLGTQLWIADGKKVRVFDRVTGAPVKTVDLAPRGAVSLRGIAVGGDDAVYVTDSARDGRIFRVSGDVVDIALAGDELRAPNAIAWDGLRFLVAPGSGRDVVAWSPGGGIKAVMRGPGAYDGIVILPNGTVIVSSEYDDALHVGYGTGDLRPLFTRKPTPAGIGFDRKRNRLLVPSREGNWLEAWTLPPMAAPVTTSRATAPSMAALPGTSSTSR